MCDSCLNKIYITRKKGKLNLPSLFPNEPDLVRLIKKGGNYFEARFMPIGKEWNARVLELSQLFMVCQSGV